jgi:hypothetical protein
MMFCQSYRVATSVLEDAVKHLYEFLQENNVDKLSTDKVKIVMENLLCYSIRLAKHHMTVNIEYTANMTGIGDSSDLIT